MYYVKMVTEENKFKNELLIRCIGESDKPREELKSKFKHITTRV